MNNKTTLANIINYEELTDTLWYTSYDKLNYIYKLLFILLWPIKIIFYFIISCRRQYYTICKPKTFNNIALWVIGNLTVGGNGKSMVIGWLFAALEQQGLNIAIVSKGYKRQYKHLIEVDANTTVLEAGDEPVMLFQQYASKIVVANCRVKAVEYLLSKYNNLDIILFDDGAQDYSLAADKKLNIINFKRCFGNKNLLPQGPLREPVTWQKFDATINIINDILDLNTDQLNLMIEFQAIYKLGDKSKNLTISNNTKVHLITAIANPNRVIELLVNLNLDLISTKCFNDHYQFTHQDFSSFNINDIVLVTEKDAVKCNIKFHPNIWVIKVGLVPNVKLVNLINSWCSELAMQT